MRRAIFGDEHEAFRRTVRAFVDRDVRPHLDRWQASGVVDRSVWMSAGQLGLLAPDVEEEYGGGGGSDYRFHVVRNEELARAGTLSPALNVHCEVVGGYLAALATPEQKKRWLPGFCSGEDISAIAITEPGAGSDVAAITTCAEPGADGYVLTGQKSFVTHGLLASNILVVARTRSPDGSSRPAAGIFMIHPDMPGVVRGPAQRKIGLHSMDTIDVFLDRVQVPRGNLLGEEGMGFLYLMQNLPRERLSIAVSAIALAERVFEETVGFCRDRAAFGDSLNALQSVRFSLAEMATGLRVAREFTDRCVLEYSQGTLSQEDSAMVKWWNTDLSTGVIDRCLQLHGGYGYTAESLVGRAFVESRSQTIYGGTTEVMKEIIGQSIAF